LPLPSHSAPDTVCFLFSLDVPAKRVGTNLSCISLCLLSCTLQLAALIGVCTIARVGRVSQANGEKRDQWLLERQSMGRVRVYQSLWSARKGRSVAVLTTVILHPLWNVLISRERRSCLLSPTTELSPEGNNLLFPLLDQPRPRRGQELPQGSISLHLLDPGERKAP
jgi:hypothetical protein